MIRYETMLSSERDVLIVAKLKSDSNPTGCKSRHAVIEKC